MRKTNVVLSFDDGRGDNYRIAINELAPRGINATFNITSGYIEKKIPLDDLCPNEPMSIDNIIEISKNPLFEIAGHGYAHDNSIQDWDKGMRKLMEWIGSDYFVKGYGIASPHSVIDDNWIKKHRTDCEKSNIKYIRTGLVNQKDLLQRGISKIARKTGSKLLMYLPIEHSLKPIEPTDYLHYSVPILHPHTIYQVVKLIEKTIRMNGDVILMFHSILNEGEDNYSSIYTWAYRKFVALCDYLYEKRKTGEIEVKTNFELIKSR